jgi:hypothetical protein
MNYPVNSNVSPFRHVCDCSQTTNNPLRVACPYAEGCCLVIQDVWLYRTFHNVIRDYKFYYILYIYILFMKPVQIEEMLKTGYSSHN